MLLVSHDPRTVMAFCDRALLLEEGRIVMAGKAEAVAGGMTADGSYFAPTMTPPEPAGAPTYAVVRSAGSSLR